MQEMQGLSRSSMVSEISDSHRQKPVRQSSPIRALICKSIVVQRKSVFTNVCQIVTPLICLLFTLVVQQIAADKVITKIGYLPYPQPMNIPGLFGLVPQFNVSCKEFYIYQADLSNQKAAQKVLNRTLSTPCPESPSNITPYFLLSDNVNKQAFQRVIEADHQTFIRNVDLTTDLPDGLISFHNISQTSLNITLAINDLRMPEYHRSNGITKVNLNLNTTALITTYLRVTQGEISLIDLITRAYLSAYTPKQVILSSIMYMPFSGEDRTLMNRIVNVIGSGLYPLGLSLLIPVFLYAVVTEKEERLLEIMKTNGLSMVSYWVVTFGFNFMLSAITFTTFYVFGTYVMKLSYFTETSGVLIMVVLFGWAIAQISLTNFVQVFISKAKSATIIGYVMAVFLTLVGQALAVGIFAAPLQMPLYLRLYPSMSLCRLFYLMAFACSNGSCYSSIHHITWQMQSSIIILYSSFILYLLSIYLYEVVQQEYGVRRSPLFFLGYLRKWFGRHTESQKSYEIFKSQVGQAEDNEEGEERGKGSIGDPLVVHAVQKKYEFSNGKKDYVAVKPLSFSIKENQIFGLLGPNGAGKTSLIAVLTGLYPPTSGDAWIQGYSIKTDLQQIRMLIGVCPQFDLLWRQLSPQQHLYFYARLKGIPQNQIKSMVEDALQEVNLKAFRNHASEKLSGGMKRRLSIAIALVGNPSLVFLDEPSSGLDPEHRRSLWNILLNCRKKRSILLTTHYMQQAEILCNRIGIITEGHLRCVGNQTDLKIKHGSGYNLIINLKKSDEHTLQQNLSNLRKFVSQNIKTISHLQFNHNIVFKLRKQDNSISQIFRKLIANKENLHIEDWAISQPSLYDVFLKVVDGENVQLSNDRNDI